MIVAVFVVFLALIIAAAVVSYRVNKKRQRAYAAWAAARGYTYAVRDDRYDDLPWGPPFGVGHSRAALDVVTGTYHARPMLCFTYLYKTTQSDGKTTTTQSHYFAITSVRLPGALPDLRVGPEGLFGALGRKLGIHDIEFESEEFNRAYKVKSGDRKLAYDIVNPQLMQRLLTQDAPGFSIVGDTLFLVARGRLPMAEIDSKLAYLDGVAGGIPSFVWDTH